MSAPLRGCELKYYNTSACDISISGGKAALDWYEDGRFHKFSIKIL